MSAPFQPGDVVQVIDGILDLKTGSIHRVVAAHPPVPGMTSTWGIRVSGADHNWLHAFQGWRHTRFRKIDDEVTEEFREQLRKLPVRERVA